MDKGKERERAILYAGLSWVRPAPGVNLAGAQRN